MPDKAKPILAAVDFSPFSEQALLWAARTARSFEQYLYATSVRCFLFRNRELDRLTGRTHGELPILTLFRHRPNRQGRVRCDPSSAQ